MTPPIRFLASALGSWVFVRGAMLVPWQPDDVRQAQGAAPRPPAELVPRPSDFPRTGSDTAHKAVLPSSARPLRARRERSRTPHLAIPVPGSAGLLPPSRLGWTLAASPIVPRPSGAATTGRSLARPSPLPPVSRWSASAWLYARSGDAPALAAGGVLGGSQAGARVAYHTSQTLALTARISAPLRRSRGAEAALGVEWQPDRSIPLRLLAERRQKLGADGRSAFALTLHGGAGEVPLPAGFRLDAYGQAGVVGARSGDIFGEASARATRPIGGGISLGAGIWGAAQQGASRLDIDPSATLRVPRLRASLSADWRFRVAGHAEPGSGPALTLWTDF